MGEDGREDVDDAALHGRSNEPRGNENVRQTCVEWENVAVGLVATRTCVEWENSRMSTAAMRTCVEWESPVKVPASVEWENVANQHRGRQNVRGMGECSNEPRDCPSVRVIGESQRPCNGRTFQ